jgi:hypothetical protein
LITPNEYEIDIQEEDMQAWHFGIYQVQSGLKELVGYTRSVVEEYTEAAKWVRQIASKYPKLIEVNSQSSPKQLFFYAFPDSELAKKLLQKCRYEGGRFTKASRLFIQKNIDNRRLLFMKLMEYYIPIITISKNVSDTSTEVEDYHVPFYTRMGFKIIECNTIYGFDMALLHAPTSEVDKTYWANAVQMNKVLKETGCIHYYPHDEENYYSPQYQSTITTI